jgi:hypothetical protein
MALDFERIKAVPINDVVLHYRISLKFNGAWGSAVCPLPTHKPGDKDKTFTVNTEKNYWLCHSDSCNQKNGGKKGGDCINFVARMESCSEYDAAKKLADWFHIGAGSNGNNGSNRAEIAQNKNGSHTESRRTDASARETPPQEDHQDHSPLPDTVKQAARYMETVDKWFDELMQRGDQEDDAAFFKRVRNGVKAKLIESYRNGKRVAQGLAPE